MQSLDLLQKLTDVVDLPGELPPGVPVIEIAGDCRVLIEQHLGLSAYSCNRICIKVGYGTVAVSGSELKLSHMTRQRLVISGQIGCVEILRRRL